MSYYPYPDDETWLCAVLAQVLPTGPDETFRRHVTEVPDDLHNVRLVPCNVVERYGGADRVIGLDVARFNIDTFATGPNAVAARSAALARGHDIHNAVMRKLAGRTFYGVAVSKVGSVSRPTIRFYDSRQTLRRAQQSVQLHLHHQA